MSEMEARIAELEELEKTAMSSEAKNRYHKQKMMLHLMMNRLKGYCV